MKKAILIINCGSSSLKYKVFIDDVEVASGVISNIGLESSAIKHIANGQTIKMAIAIPDHAAAIAAMIQALTNKEYGVIESLDQIAAVGHRVLHGGTKITMFEANTDASTKLWLDQMMDLEEYFNTVYPESNGKPYGESIIGAYNVLSKVQGNGKYVYFPYTPQFITIWYNMDIFDACGITEKPKTWNELMDICQILVDNGYTPFTSDQGHIHMALGYYLQRRLGGEAAEALATSKTGEEWNDPAVLEVIKEF